VFLPAGDRALEALAIARVHPDELLARIIALLGGEWAIYALERVPEDIRARFAECIAFARDSASALIANVLSPPPWNNRDLLLLCKDLATALNAISCAISAKIKRRKPRLDRDIARAEKASGKVVTSITLPDGTRLGFGEPEKSQDNPLDQWLAKKHARAPQGH
jgi:hypothetical protein